MKPIAHIQTEFPTKFGIPRQSGLIDALKSTLIFEPDYRNPDAVRGLESFSHIWLLWQFSENVRDTWSPTVRPPRLGGNIRMGVFATRAPFRPNPLGLSSVRLEKVELHTPVGPVLHLAGADLMDGTPIYDIKPYVESDCHPDAVCGFTNTVPVSVLEVVFPQELLTRVPEVHRAALTAVLAADPRPRYQNDPVRIYGLEFAGFDIRFQVNGTVLTVCDVLPL